MNVPRTAERFIKGIHSRVDRNVPLHSQKRNIDLRLLQLPELCPSV